MIEKIINNYLTNALIKWFRTTALLRNIELLVIPRKNEISIYAKDRKYTENNYKKVMVFDKGASIYYLCNLIKSKEEFDEILKKYQEREC